MVRETVYMSSISQLLLHRNRRKGSESGRIKKGPDHECITLTSPRGGETRIPPRYARSKGTLKDIPIKETVTSVVGSKESLKEEKTMMDVELKGREERETKRSPPNISMGTGAIRRDGSRIY